MGLQFDNLGLVNEKPAKIHSKIVLYPPEKFLRRCRAIDEIPASVLNDFIENFCSNGNSTTSTSQAYVPENGPE